MQGIQYILFDLDGTLTDPKEGITRCVQYALEKFDIHEPDLDNLICFIGPPLRESFQQYYGLSMEEAEEAVAFYRERYRPIGLFENRVFDGIADMLEALQKSGKIICLATSKPQEFAEKILDKYELRQYFSIVVGSELNGVRDRKSDVIEEVLRLAGAQEKQAHVIMVGDRHHDIEGAKTCCLPSVGVTFGYAEPGELEKAGATYIAHSVAELTALLLKL